MTELFVYLALVATILAVGVRVGLIVAPRLGAWIERHEESGRDDE